VDSVDVTQTSQELIEEILQLAYTHPGIEECNILSVLEVKGKYRVSMNSIVDKRLTLEQVHAISTALENKIMVTFPHIKDVNIHAEPSLQ
jgi:divalent metal cation (Fe/Co/Zn/Cd) transporter